MNHLAAALEPIALGAAQTCRNLSLFPLFGPGHDQPEYRLLDAALESGQAEVTEVSEQGSVPSLKLVNYADVALLALDGEELVGAKQNRILNVSLLAPARSDLIIPVSCVEAGRWSHTSHAFKSGGRAHHASGRARKTASVSRSLRERRSFESDQDDVWDDIRSKQARMAVESRTAAASDLYETHRDRVEDYVNRLPPVPGQVGALFAFNGRVAGLDLFDRATSLSANLPKLVRSYALDALEQAPTCGPTPRAEVETFLDAVAIGRCERYPGVGLGETLRQSTPKVTASALVVDGQLIHLCAFALTPFGNERTHQGSRLARASRRRRLS